MAVALEADGQRDHATVHFGESAEGPDDEIADRLESLSVDEARRGDHGAASTLAWRAGALRTDRDQRARDWLRSGTEAATAGITYGARLEAALDETDDPSLIAEIQVTRARLATLGGDPDFAVELLGSHGETIIAADPFLGAVLTALAGSCAWMRADGTATKVLADQAVALVGGQVTAEMIPIANFLIRAGAATGYDDPALAVSTARMIQGERSDRVRRPGPVQPDGRRPDRRSGRVLSLGHRRRPRRRVHHRRGLVARARHPVAVPTGPPRCRLRRGVRGDRPRSLRGRPVPAGDRRTARSRYVCAVRGDRARCEEHVAETFRLATTADIQIAWLAARHAGALALLGDRLTDAALEGARAARRGSRTSWHLWRHDLPDACPS